MGAPELIVPGTASGTAPVGGTGTTNTIPRWTGPTTLGDSLITQDTNARAIGVATASLAPWGSAYRAIQIGQSAAIMCATVATNDAWYLSNGYWDGSVFRYTATGPALAYSQASTGHQWRYAASGTAGAAFAFTDGMILNTSGNVGIGTASPNAKLEIASTSSGGAQFRLSNAAGLTNWWEIGRDNATTGALIFASNTGERMRISPGTSQVAIGTSSFTTGRALTTVADLDVFGVRVGRGASGVSDNTAVGAAALASVTTGSGTVGVGFESLNALTTGVGNTAVGYRALWNVSTTNSNTAVGYLACGNRVGTNNTGIGQQALQGAVGSSGNNNTGAGYQTGLALTTGAGNTLLGSAAGDSITTGSSNIVIGYNADTAAATDSNKLVIGDATNYVATNGGATTYYATAGALAGYIIVRLNGTDVKLPVYAL